MSNEFCLGRDVLQELVKLVQLGMMTGTDVANNMQLLRLELVPDDSGDVQTLRLTANYKKDAAAGLEKLVQQARDLASQNSNVN